MFAKIAAASLLALAACSATVSTASAASPYDGRWSLTINTQRGTCDTYNLSLIHI